MCELQRICYHTLPGASRSLQVEYSLTYSKQESIKIMIKHLDKLSTDMKLRESLTDALHYSLVLVMDCKDINPRIHPQFVKSFSRCIEHIWGYKQLLEELSFLAATPYDSDNEEHEAKLMKLWQLLQPGVHLDGRKSVQWQDIGFQGNDPKTDFRGMGILGLNNLLFFAEEYNSRALSALQHSLHPSAGYAFAILGINITNLAYNLLSDGVAKTHFYNISRRSPGIDSFHHFYCYLFIEFDKFWIYSKPVDIMDFAKIRQSFEHIIRQSLKNKNCTFMIKSTEI